MKYLQYLLVLILVVGSAAGGFFWTKNSLLKEPSVQGVTSSAPTQVPTAKPTPSYEKTIGNFLITDKEICLENGKPIVYFFGSSSCPHCVWEKPVAQGVFNKFKGEIAYHENFDSQTDFEVFEKYSDINPGYVPFLIVGCKYARVGAGENLGDTPEESKKLEEEALTALVCKLTDSKPSSVCNPLKDKISEVK
jgi:thiol-disulfide isomerase/thioredoxin